MNTRFPRMWALVVMFLVPVAVAPASISSSRAAEQESTPVGSDDEPVVTLFSEIAGGLDEFGRATLFRLTFQGSAGVGPEDLPAPFVAYVESGSFKYRDASGAYTDVQAGAVLTAESGDDYAIRNADLSRATLLVLSLPGSCMRFAEYACGPLFLSYDFLCDSPCRPDVTNTLLFMQQEVVQRFMPVTYSLHKVTLDPDQEFASFDNFGGETSLIRLLVRVDVGAVQSSTGDTYTAGDAHQPVPGETLVATDSNGTELLVLRIAEAP